MNARTNIQIINGPDGKPAFVVIPYSEYRSDALEDLTPHQVVCLMVDNDWTPVRAWREYLGLTQGEMARRLDVSQSAYSQQEASAKLRKSTRENIAAAFGIKPEMLDV